MYLSHVSNVFVWIVKHICQKWPQDNEQIISWWRNSTLFKNCFSCVIWLKEDRLLFLVRIFKYDTKSVPDVEDSHFLWKVAAEVPPGHNVPYLDFILSNLCRDIFWQRRAAAYRAGDIWGGYSKGGQKRGWWRGEGIECGPNKRHCSCRAKNAFLPSANPSSV